MYLEEWSYREREKEEEEYGESKFVEGKRWILRRQVFAYAILRGINDPLCGVFRSFGS